VAGVRCRAQGEEFRGEHPDPAAAVLRGADDSVPPEPGQRTADRDTGDSEQVGEFALTAGEGDVAVGSVPGEAVQQPGCEAGLAGERGRVGEPFLLGAGLGGEEPEDVGAESSSRVVNWPRGTARTAHGVSAVKVAVWPAPSSRATLSRAQGPAHVPNRMTRPAAVVADADAVPSSRASRWSAGVPWLRRVSPGA
jgi:hypothetical protein